MSKHLIEINFDQLNFNLYDLLGVDNKASSSKIKKAYRKLIIKFHPDKNDKIDEDIYNHLTISNQVLTNDELRSKYDKWLASYDVSQTHENLKESFNTQVKNDKKNKSPSKNENNEKPVESFSSLEKKLNKKHGYDFVNGDLVDQPMSENTINQKINELQKEMQSIGISITKEEIRNTMDFNNKFSNRKNDGELKNQIVKVDKKNEIMELNKKEIGDKYLSITNYNMLYSNDAVDTTDYASLEQGFNLLPNENDLKDNRRREYDESKGFHSYAEAYRKETDELINKNKNGISKRNSNGN
tara:strand:+ start:23 stop:919 length:897 start_codon:yes stop_codon:yes gene_type:complete